ncbi:RagB/SusD family nutrient uptake outer membrane protein [Pedobacter sp. MW01-1-1]|uniref:RagB/SusD family nutrient uptake outer membrane protein n=1 Tax=Pedobacter sp. MW01-1-1 TaxID=3383027 RepID=UPI003FEEB46A
MKKFITIAVLLVATINLTSCKKWLDVAPKTEIKGDVLFSNQNGFRDALTGVYTLMIDSNSYGSALSMGTVDVMAQTYDNVRTTVNHNYSKISTYSYTELQSANRFANIWKQQYKAIVNTNLILSYVDKKQDVFKPGVYQAVKGESLGLRAMFHLDLLRLFSPSVALGSSRKAIPYVDAYTNVPFPQSTVNEVLEKVIRDLTEAKSLLKDVDPLGPNSANINLSTIDPILANRNTRMNYYAVTAMLARAYLYKGDKVNALLNAKEVIQSTLFPWFNQGTGTVLSDYTFPTEQLFCLKVAGLKTLYSDRYFPDLIDGNSTIQLTISNTSFANIYPSVLGTDYRLNWFTAANTGNTKITKYLYGANNFIPLIKKSEMYLIAAECEPNTTTAINTYLNPLKSNRGLTALDPATTTAAQLTTEIGNEYRKEFVGEGQLFFYYKRMNISKLPTIPAFTNTESVYVLPIPDAEIEFGNIN